MATVGCTWTETYTGVTYNRGALCQLIWLLFSTGWGKTGLVLWVCVSCLLLYTPA